MQQQEYRDIAQVCVMGHLVNSASTKNPNHNKKHCELCGGVTISECPECRAAIYGPEPIKSIRRDPASPVIVKYELFYGYQLPKFCRECGYPYPWTTSALIAAQELIAEDEALSVEDVATLSKNLPALISDTVQTPVASQRVRSTLARAGEITVDGVSKILIGVITEAAKKAAFPGL